MITKALIRLRGCAGLSAPWLFANPRRQRSIYDKYQYLTCWFKKLNGLTETVVIIWLKYLLDILQIFCTDSFCLCDFNYVDSSSTSGINIDMVSYLFTFF